MSYSSFAIAITLDLRDFTQDTHVLALDPTRPAIRRVHGNERAHDQDEE